MRVFRRMQVLLTVLRHAVQVMQAVCLAVVAQPVPRLSAVAVSALSRYVAMVRFGEWPRYSPAGKVPLDVVRIVAGSGRDVGYLPWLRRARRLHRYSLATWAASLRTSRPESA